MKSFKLYRFFRKKNKIFSLKTLETGNKTENLHGDEPGAGHGNGTGHKTMARYYTWSCFEHVFVTPLSSSHPPSPLPFIEFYLYTECIFLEGFLMYLCHRDILETTQGKWVYQAVKNSVAVVVVLFVDVVIYMNALRFS